MPPPSLPVHASSLLPPMHPAHNTKHIPVLPLPLRPLSRPLLLAQRVSPLSNGTSLWLGAQVLFLYLASSLPSSGVRRRACDLGAGVGMTALALASLGWDVCATDVPVVVHGVLHENIALNPPEQAWGRVCARVLDWESDADRLGDVLGDAEVPPPYDLLLTADTIYSPALVSPLFRTLRELSLLSLSPAPKPRAPPVYLCLERRDPLLTDAALAEAREKWGFDVKRVPPAKVRKAVEKGGLDWAECEGVEVWKLVLKDVGGGGPG